MKNVGVIYSDIYAKHDTGNHPESAKRVLNTIKLLKNLQIYGESRKSHFKEINPRKVALNQIAWVHSKNFIQGVESISKRAKKINELLDIDADTVVSGDSFEASLNAVGGNFSAVDAILEDKINRAFVLCRPPGHHSNGENARGFCIFNNIILTAEYLIREKGIKRITIFDFDAHAGNGSEDLLNERGVDGEIQFFSFHQHPETLYPGTCFANEIGIGKQKGRITNLTLAPLSGQKSVEMCMNQIVIPMIEEFKPEFILVSAGYDAHHDDPLTQMGFMDQTYTYFIRELAKLSEKYANGRIQCTLEGGYNLTALGHSIANTINALADDKIIYMEEDNFIESTKNLEFTEKELIPSLKNFLSPYYKCLR
ncbi:MAG: histone deacetylase family protein [Promethearchaeota archaeon]